MEIQTSNTFKKNVAKTILSILVFVISIILLLAVLIVLTMSSIHFAIQQLFSLGNVFTIIFLSLLSICLFTIFNYLVKFLSSDTETDEKEFKQVKVDEEPDLFALIKEVAQEVGTTLPKKVYLDYSTDISILLKSSFWNIFLPASINLQVGIGLINAVSKQELKAILAHEFGHFSYKRRKVETLIYKTHQIIYNLLYRNEYWNKMIITWHILSGSIVILMFIPIFSIKKIYYTLERLYNYINENYSSISKEVEFHTDEIAAEIAGSAAILNSLLRIHYAKAMLRHVIEYYEENFDKNIKSSNIYNDQFALMFFYAKINKYPIHENLPIITIENLKKYKPSKLNIQIDWHSHSKEQERIIALKKRNIIKEDVDNKRAITILKDNAAIAQKISDEIFSNGSYEEKPIAQSTAQFMADYQFTYENNNFSSIYNQYFELTNLQVDKKGMDNTSPSQYSLEELFSKDKLDILNELRTFENEKLKLEAIEKEFIKVRNFEYNGIKYNKSKAREVIELIDVSIKQLDLDIRSHKNEIYRYFYQLAIEQQKEKKLYSLYYEMALLEEQASSIKFFYNHLVDKTVFITKNTHYTIIIENLKQLEIDEKRLKKELLELLRIETLKEKLNSHILKNVEKYIYNDLQYFDMKRKLFIDENLDLLYEAIDQFKALYNIKYFIREKELLDFQASLISTTT